ncbi:MAG: hypothetical protein JG765_2630 [Cereibacter sp.]|nr:hypothetical protein [Cereibacter sp.]
MRQDGLAEKGEGLDYREGLPRPIVQIAADENAPDAQNVVEPARCLDPGRAARQPQIHQGEVGTFPACRLLAAFDIPRDARHPMPQDFDLILQIERDEELVLDDQNTQRRAFPSGTRMTTRCPGEASSVLMEA